MVALGVGGKECQQNIGEKLPLKAFAWKTEKDKDNINIDSSKMGI
jgi:hypothetical protein